MREILETRQDFTISLYTQITLDGMSEVFKNVNSGVPLNGQELRNAYSTPWDFGMFAMFLMQVSALLERCSKIMSFVFVEKSGSLIALT